MCYAFGKTAKRCTRHTEHAVSHNNDICKIGEIAHFTKYIWRSRWPCIVINSYNKTNQMHWFLKFIFGIKLCMFRTVRLSIIRSFSLYTQQWYMSYTLRAGSGRNCSSVLILLASCMTYTIAVCTAKNSWSWTEELSETCRVLFQK